MGSQPSSASTKQGATHFHKEIMMKLGAICVLAIGVTGHSGAGQPEIEQAIALANAVEAKENNQKIEVEAEVAADATNAEIAAETAKQAAHVATKVAEHSVKISAHAKSALADAQDALHKARAETQGLSSNQKSSLETAEEKLREATRSADHGKVKEAKYVKAAKTEKKMAEKMEVIKGKQSLDRFGKRHQEDKSELGEMEEEVKELRKALKDEGDKSNDDALKELQKEIKEMEEAEKTEDKSDSKSHDEMKAEIERLRDQLKKLEEARKKAPKKKVKKVASKAKVAPLSGKAVDIDMDMPYGDLEPFGREDTAQELTESSIKESDEMVDQLERAEVAEEKRAVFRALTRLRGAAITSFDGVARSQTGNIDQYNKVNKWRNKHPVRHLADEESDVTKWAFPDNADFLQK